MARLFQLPGTIGSIVAGWDVVGLQGYSLGYVNLLGFFLIAPASFAMAPAGAWLAHNTDKNRVRVVFAAFIAITSGGMLYDALF